MLVYLPRNAFVAYNGGVSLIGSIQPQLEVLDLLAQVFVVKKILFGIMRNRSNGKRKESSSGHDDAMSQAHSTVELPYQSCHVSISPLGF